MWHNPTDDNIMVDMDDNLGLMENYEEVEGYGKYDLLFGLLGGFGLGMIGGYYFKRKN